MAAPTVLRAATTSGAISCVADVLAQAVETRGFSNAGHDLHRTTLFALVGGTLHGPYFFLTFRWLDKFFGPATSLLVVAKKTVFTQFALNAPYMCILFTYLGALEGRATGPSGGLGPLLSNTGEKFLPAFWTGNVFWPVANSFNFALVPTQHRVAYVAACGACWNTYISMLNKNATLMQK